MPTIKKPNQHFDATLYTGNGTYPRSLTNTAGFKPDLVWVKARSIDYIHVVYDSVRGTGTTKSLSTQATDAEGSFSIYTNLSAFTSNGFTVDTTSSTNIMNNNATTFVAWQWKAGGASTVNTSGTISSNVSVNTTAGFSVVTYTGNGSAGATIGHSLGVAPKWVIVKNRGSSVDDWLHYHTSLGATKSIAFDTNAAVTSSTRWNNTTPSSTLITLGTSAGVNASSNTYVAYCFAEVEGYSKFGSYTGNGSTDGPFLYTGFRPKFVMIKHTNVGGNNWRLVDTSRLGYNADNYPLFPSLADAESATVVCDLLSNGIKFRSTAQGVNGSSDSYIYMAFAEAPFKYSNAR